MESNRSILIYAISSSNPLVEVNSGRTTIKRTVQNLADECRARGIAISANVLTWHTSVILARDATQRVGGVRSDIFVQQPKIPAN